jgi:endosialidase-like protein
MNPLSQRETTILRTLVAFLLACFAVLPIAQAVTPPPDGDYGPPRFGPGNTAEGDNALLGLAAGQYNTAVGILSLGSLVDGNFNTGVGAGALMANTADNNTATGAAALMSNTTGEDNTANGFNALGQNVGGFANTAMGSQALAFNTGFDNTAIGFQALASNTDGVFNAAIGRDSLLLNTTGGGNTAAGYGALESNTTGILNTALGFFAGFNVTDAFNVICIGSLGDNVSNSTWIQNVYSITPQSGTTAPVVVSDGGQLGTVASSERFKKDIANMEKASEMILSLRPVTFHYKSDAKETPQFGLIAEEVANVNPALVLPDKDGKPYTVRYDAVNAMLLNEFLKEHRKVEKLEAALRAVNQRLSEQDAEIRKVRAEIELSKPAPQTVLSDR